MSKRMDSWLKVGSFNKKDEYYTPAIMVYPIIGYLIPGSTIIALKGCVPFAASRSWRTLISQTTNRETITLTGVVSGYNAVIADNVPIIGRKCRVLCRTPPVTVAAKVVE